MVVTRWPIGAWRTWRRWNWTQRRRCSAAWRERWPSGGAAASTRRWPSCARWSPPWPTTRPPAPSTPKCSASTANGWPKRAPRTLAESSPRYEPGPMRFFSTPTAFAPLWYICSSLSLYVLMSNSLSFFKKCALDEGVKKIKQQKTSAHKRNEAILSFFFTFCWTSASAKPSTWLPPRPPRSIPPPEKPWQRWPPPVPPWPPTLTPCTKTPSPTSNRGSFKCTWNW